MIDVPAVGPDDWPAWRRLRRAALAEAPDAFGSTLAQWSDDADTEQRWRNRLTDVPLNLVAVIDDEPVGMVSATGPGRDGAVELISLWVAPAARGHGLGDELVRRVVDWAAACQPGNTVVLSVKADNRHAGRLYERLGFTDLGRSPDSPDELFWVRLWWRDRVECEPLTTDDAGGVQRRFVG